MGISPFRFPSSRYSILSAVHRRRHVFFLPSLEDGFPLADGGRWGILGVLKKEDTEGQNDGDQCGV